MSSTRDIGVGATIDVNSVPLDQKYTVAVLLGVAIWNALEMLPIIYFTFTRYTGLYFWSMIASTVGVLVYATGFVLNNFQLTGSQTLPTILTCTGWVPMVSAQSLILYSRLHFINTNEAVRHLVLTMIIFNGITLHTGTALTTIGSNGENAQIFIQPYAIMERIQVTVFFTQELILSGLYLWKACGFLNWRRSRESGTRAQRNLRSMMLHLVLSNVLVVALDITILILEFMGLYFIQVSYKAFVYAVKLKCEIGILNRLVDFVKSTTAAKRNGPPPHYPDRSQNNNCYSFHLSSQIEREWQTTLRNTFGVAMDDEEKKENKSKTTNAADDEQTALVSRLSPELVESRLKASRGSRTDEGEGGGRRSTASERERLGKGGGPGLRTFGRDSVDRASAHPGRPLSVNFGDNGGGGGGFDGVHAAMESETGSPACWERVDGSVHMLPRPQELHFRDSSREQ